MNNRGLRARLQQHGGAGLALFEPEILAQPNGNAPTQTIWEMARRLGGVL
jgi:hypothetical protein